MRTITVQPGIGDNLWLMMKLVNAQESFNFIIPGGQPRRGKQIFDMLPSISASAEYGDIIPYKTVNAKNAAKPGVQWSQINDDHFFLSANEHLEKGRRIEKFLPDLPTSSTLPIVTSDQDKDIASQLLPTGPAYIGIYTSAYSNARHWDGWQATEWKRFISLMNVPGRPVFVLIGAEYDIGIPDELVDWMKEAGISYVSTVGQPLGVVAVILKLSRYFVGFPSGLSILDERLGMDGTMMYPKHLHPMMNTWAHPDRIANGNYKGCLFPEPEQLYDWIKNVYKIHDKI